MTAALAELVMPHLDRTDLAARIAAFYAAVDEAVAAHGPVCRNRGLCCGFDRFGHSLFVTTVELAYFVRCSRDLRPAASGSTCPYHVDGVCRARDSRPLGCRVFFCDPLSRHWQGPTYERGLAELKRIGTAFGIDYRYVEWLSALGELTAEKPGKQAGLTPPAGV